MFKTACHRILNQVHLTDISIEAVLDFFAFQKCAKDMIKLKKYTKGPCIIVKLSKPFSNYLSWFADRNEISFKRYPG